jgi:hypothetical protein
MLSSSLCTPDNAGGSTGGVEAGVGAVAFVGVAELAMGLRVDFWVGC